MSSCLIETVGVHSCVCLYVCLHTLLQKKEKKNHRERFTVAVRVRVLVHVIIDFGFITGSRAVLYLGPNQSVSLTISWDLPAGGGDRKERERV